MSLIAPPSPTVLSAIGRRFGVVAGEVHPLPEGEANSAYRLGDGLILRIPRDDGQLTADLLKERVVIPVARSAGVLTPEIVAFDESRLDIDAPYLVVRRVPGTDLERSSLPPAQSYQVYREVGRNLALLHACALPGSLPGVSVDDASGDPGDLLAPLASAHALDPDTAEWLGRWFDRLAPFVPDRAPMVLIHGDIAPRNVLADPATGGLTGIVDWGDAAFADPAMDFAKLPLAVLPAAIEGYLGQTDWSEDGFRSWQARAFRYQLHWAVAALGRRDPETGQLRPPGPATARLLVILRFLIETSDERWIWLRTDVPDARQSVGQMMG